MTLSGETTLFGELFIAHEPDCEDARKLGEFQRDKYIARVIPYSESDTVLVFVYERMQPQQAMIELLRSLLRLSMEYRIVATNGNYLELTQNAESEVFGEQIQLRRLDD